MPLLSAANVTAAATAAAAFFVMIITINIMHIICLNLPLSMTECQMCLRALYNIRRRIVGFVDDSRYGMTQVRIQSIQHTIDIEKTLPNTIIFV
jgi:hypothetical protein